MTTKRLWAISGGAVVFVILLVLLISAVSSGDADSAPISAPSSSPSPRPIGSAPSAPTPTPTPTPTPVEAVVATCENISTTEFQAMMASNGWVSWTPETSGREWSPFGSFPNGAPRGELACTWGEDVNLGTDNVISLAWAPIDPENAVAAMQALEQGGFNRVESPEGVYLTMAGTPASQANGYEESYLFTPFDVRWAVTKSDLTFVKAPTDPQ